MGEGTENSGTERCQPLAFCPLEAMCSAVGFGGAHPVDYEINELRPNNPLRKRSVSPVHDGLLNRRRGSTPPCEETTKTGVTLVGARARFASARSDCWFV